jgi:hypothetical protein
VSRYLVKKCRWYNVSKYETSYDINQSIENDKEINFLKNIKKRKYEEKDNKTNNEEEKDSSWINKGIMSFKKYFKSSKICELCGANTDQFYIGKIKKNICKMCMEDEDNY